MIGSGYEALCSAAEMRAAEEAFPGFPATAVDLMADAPSTVDAKQLRELNLRVQR